MVCFGNAEQPPGSPNPFFSPKLRIMLRLQGTAAILSESESQGELKGFFCFLSHFAFA